MRTFCFSLLVALSFTCFSEANIAYVESVDGDLSGTTTNPFEPNPATDLGIASLGANTVTGTLDNGASFIDQDIFSFTVAAGQQLDSILFTNMQEVVGPHFVAFNVGPTSALGPDNLFASLVSNQTLANTLAVGENILDADFAHFGSAANTVIGPLGPGNYHVWFQETDGSDNDYTIQFNISQIPEPGTGAMLLCFALGTVLRRKRV